MHSGEAIFPQFHYSHNKFTCSKNPFILSSASRTEVPEEDKVEARKTVAINLMLSSFTFCTFKRVQVSSNVDLDGLELIGNVYE